MVATLPKGEIIEAVRKIWKAARIIEQSRGSTLNRSSSPMPRRTWSAFGANLDPDYDHAATTYRNEMKYIYLVMPLRGAWLHSPE
jgi:hypothetical protein